jgi:hypothetical protein
VIDIPAGLNYADTINDFSGLIELEAQLGQAVQIAIWIRAYHKGNLWFGEPDFSRSCHRSKLMQRPVADPVVSCFLVVSPPVRDLLI